MILLSTARKTYVTALRPICTLTFGDSNNLLHRIAEIISWRTSSGKARLEGTVSSIPRCWPRKGNTSHHCSHGELQEQKLSCRRKGTGCVCVIWHVCINYALENVTAAILHMYYSSVQFCLWCATVNCSRSSSCTHKLQGVSWHVHR